MKPGDKVSVKLTWDMRAIGTLVEEHPEKGGWLVDVDGMRGGFGYNEIRPVTPASGREQ